MWATAGEQLLASVRAQRETEGVTMKRKTLLVTIGCAWFTSLTLSGSTAWSQRVEPPKDGAAAQAERKASAWLHDVYFREMSAYEFFFDAEKQKS